MRHRAMMEVIAQCFIRERPLMKAPMKRPFPFLFPASMHGREDRFRLVFMIAPVPSQGA